jgi:hypothetical protein
VDATRQEWAAKTLTFTPVTNVHMAASRIISEAAIKHAPFRNSDYSRYAGYFKITGIIRITGVAKELGRRRSEPGRYCVIANARLHYVTCRDHLAKQNPHVLYLHAG